MTDQLYIAINGELFPVESDEAQATLDQAKHDLNKIKEHLVKGGLKNARLTPLPFTNES